MFRIANNNWGFVSDLPGPYIYTAKVHTFMGLYYGLLLSSTFAPVPGFVL